VTGEFNVLCYTFLCLFMVSFIVWAIYSWTGYGQRYAPHADGWYKGGTRSIEVTLVREDMQNLACARTWRRRNALCVSRQPAAL